MIIKQEEEFKPVTITLETKAEYHAFISIIDEADAVPSGHIQHMSSMAKDLVVSLSNYFTNKG